MQFDYKEFHIDAPPLDEGGRYSARAKICRRASTGGDAVEVSIRVASVITPPTRTLSKQRSVGRSSARLYPCSQLAFCGASSTSSPNFDATKHRMLAISDVFPV